MHVHSHKLFFLSCSVKVKLDKFFDCIINTSTPIETHIFPWKRPINLNPSWNSRELCMLSLAFYLYLYLFLWSSLVLTHRQQNSQFPFLSAVKLLNRVPGLTSLWMMAHLTSLFCCSRESLEIDNRILKLENLQVSVPQFLRTHLVPLRD